MTRRTRPADIRAVAAAAGWPSVPREDCDTCETRADHDDHQLAAARAYLDHLPDDDAHQETA